MIRIMITLAFAFVATAASAFPLPRVKNTKKLPPTFTTDYNFEGIVALDDCSGSIVRFENSQDSDPAMVLTNGHCYEGGFLNPGQFLNNVASDREFSVLDTQGNELGTLTATKVIYATMTTTDMTLYQTGMTYADIKQRYNTRPLTLSSQHPTAGAPIDIISGYWQRGYSCKVDTFIFKLEEGGYTWNDSIRYTEPGCEVIGGTSGSPVIAQGTRTMIGINNTGNEDGQKCTDNNPCEVDQNGNITYKEGNNYAEETYQIYSCLNKSNQIDLSTPGCQLPHQ